MRTTESDRLAIVAARAAGVGMAELAKRYKVSRQTISNVLGKLKVAKHPEAREEFDAIVYRSRLRKKGFLAVEAGLDCLDDPYKRATIGTVTLKGLGDFSPDVSTSVNVFVAQISSLPEDWRNEYVSGDESGTVLLETSIVDDDSYV